MTSAPVPETRSRVDRETRFQCIVPETGRDMRLDLFLLDTNRFDSRQQIQRLIRKGLVLVAGAPAKPACRLRPLQVIQVRIPPPEPPESEPDAIPLRILFEDADLLVVDKPAGMVVHPAAGHRRNTLVNALLHHCRDLSGIGLGEGAIKEISAATPKSKPGKAKAKPKGAAKKSPAATS